MRIQLNTTTYDGCDLTAQVSRSTSNIPGLTTLNVSIELPIATQLPQTPQLISCVLSEDTANPIKWFSGWYLGADATPTNNNQSFLWTFKIADVLFYLANSKSVSNYSNSTSLETHALNIATLAERPAIPGVYRYLDIEASPDTDPFSFVIENNSFNLQTALAELAKKVGYEVTVRELGWTDHATLFASNNAITAIILREAGTIAEIAPIASVTWDPTSVNFCDFPFTDFRFGFEQEGITSAEVLGKGGSKAKDDGETIETSYSKYFFFQIIKPNTDTNIDDFEVQLNLNGDINKVNQAILITANNTSTQLEIVEPYDPNTPLTAGKFYFDRESNPPRIILFKDDVLALTQQATLAVLVNFQFIKVIETDAASSTVLGTATHGAFNKAYRTVNDQSITDFSSATSIAQSTLAEAKKGNFVCSGKRETTSENWLNGQLMRVQIPSQSIDKYVKVISSNGTVKGKIFENNEYRDLIEYSLSFAEIDKNIFSGVFLAKLGGLARSGGNGGNNPGFPGYEEIPFNDGGVPCSTTYTLAGSGNYGINNKFFFFDYFLPAEYDLATELIYTAQLWNIKESTAFGVYWDAEPDVDLLNLTVTFNGTEIYNEDITSSFYDTTTVLSLSAYAGQSGELVATLSLVSQTGATGSNSYYAFQMDIDCCSINTVIGTGPTGVGNGSSNGDGLAPLATLLSSPSGVAVHPTTKEIYFADQDTSVDGGYRVRKLNSATNLIEAVGGNGESSGGGTTDGVDATTLDFGEVTDLVFYDGKLYVNLQDYPEVGYIDLATGFYHKVIEVSDFTALSLGFTPEPTAMAIDPTNGNIYLASGSVSIGRNYIYKWNGTALSIYAGMGIAGFSGDGGAATGARLHLPQGLTCDSSGNLYIADYLNHRIRKITKSTGVITTVAGGGAGNTFGALATSMDLSGGDAVASVVVDQTTGDIYFSGSSTPGQTLRVKASDSTIERYLGTNTSLDPSSSFSGDGGPLRTAAIAPYDIFPGRIAILRENNISHLIFADAANQRIRRTYCGELP